MWWSDLSQVARRTIVLGAIALVPMACGFTPAYGPGGSGGGLVGQVTVVAPNDSNGFVLRQHLEDRLGPATSPTYRLDVSIQSDERRVAVTRNQATRRFNIVGVASYTLTDARNGALTTGTVETFTSYSATGTTVATAASQRDGYRRLMIALADRILNELLAAGTPPGSVSQTAGQP